LIHTVTRRSRTSERTLWRTLLLAAALWIISLCGCGSTATASPQASYRVVTGEAHELTASELQAQTRPGQEVWVGGAIDNLSVSSTGDLTVRFGIDGQIVVWLVLPGDRQSALHTGNRVRVRFVFDGEIAGDSVAPGSRNVLINRSVLWIGRPSSFQGLLAVPSAPSPG